MYLILVFAQSDRQVNMFFYLLGQDNSPKENIAGTYRNEANTSLSGCLGPAFIYHMGMLYFDRDT